MSGPDPTDERERSAAPPTLPKLRFGQGESYRMRSTSTDERTRGTDERTRGTDERTRGTDERTRGSIDESAGYTRNGPSRYDSSNGSARYDSKTRYESPISNGQSRYDTSSGARYDSSSLSKGFSSSSTSVDSDYNSLRTKQDSREAFFRGTDKDPMPQPKYDPNIRERDGLREKDLIREKDQINMNGDMKNSASNPSQKTKEMDGYVGFANLPNQVYRKAVKRGFEFTLMVVGESGLGKSTLINSMFLTDLYSTEHPGPSHRIKKTINVESTQVLLKENGVQLRLTVVDTPGFGDAVDNSDCWQPVINHVESQYDAYLNAESRVNRKVSADDRVHCCLYFVSPNGHGLKPLDIEFMKRLHDKVNIIPIIAKSDTMTVDECRDFKKTILNEIQQNKIRIYEFPDCDDEEEKKHQKKLKERVPFAVVGSNTVVEANGKRTRGRVYPWGVVEVENLEHNDFIALRNMLIRTHMQDLKDVTNNVHYENFRYGKLAAVTSGTTSKSGGKPTSNSKSPLLQMEEERKEHLSKMKKMEAEMEQVFEMKVKEKKQKLKDSEQDLVRRAEQMKKSLEQQKAEMDQKRRQFEAERGQWDEQELQRRRSLETRESEKNKNKKKTLF